MRIAITLLACFGVCLAAPVSNSVTSQDVTSFLSSLALADANKAASGQVVVAYQNQASTKTFDHDNAANPLFTTVAPALLEKPTYKSLLHLISLYPSQDADVVDADSQERTAAALSFITEMSSTNVFTQAWNYLQSAGVASASLDDFRQQLYDLWFKPFSRNTVKGSSGFKATFVGEFLDDQVIGLTNWIRFSQLEAVKGVNYHGWFTRQIDVQVKLQFGLELPEGEKQAFMSNLLLGTSPEFEFMAYSTCVLSGTAPCSLMMSGNEVLLNVQTVEVDGATVVSVAYPDLGGAAAATTKKPTTKAPAKDAELQTLVNNMRAQDADKPTTSQYKLTWGTKLGNNPKPTSDHLMSNVDESLFNKATYAALKKVYDNNVLVPNTCTAEQDYNSGFKKQILQGVLDQWATTKPFTLMHTYLVNKGKASSDMTTFKNYLFNFWFGTYSRCANNKKIMGSSGFEHVFSGEWKDNTVDGHHNWMKYYLDQKANNIKYYGYYSYDAQLTGTYEYDWSDHNKKTGGMLFGTSPAFDFSLFTACSIAHSGATACRFTLDGYELAVTSYTQDCDAGTCLSTCYPVDEL